MKFVDNHTIEIDKELNELDQFVRDFISILKKHTKYVIVSGYVAILLGRDRGTEDVDIIIPKMNIEAFEHLNNTLSKTATGASMRLIQKNYTIFYVASIAFGTQSNQWFRPT